MQAHTTMRQSERRIGKFNATRRFVLCFFLCFFPLPPHPPSFPFTVTIQRFCRNGTQVNERSSHGGVVSSVEPIHAPLHTCMCGGGAGLCCVYCTCVSGTGRLECKRREVKPFEVYLPRYSSVNFNSLSQSVPGSRSRSGPFPLSLSLFLLFSIVSALSCGFANERHILTCRQLSCCCLNGDVNP